MQLEVTRGFGQPSTHMIWFTFIEYYLGTLENKFVGRESYNCNKWRVLSDSYYANSRERTLSCTKVERVDRNRGKHTDSRNALEYANSVNRSGVGYESQRDIKITLGYATSNADAFSFWEGTYILSYVPYI